MRVPSIKLIKLKFFPYFSGKLDKTIKQLLEKFLEKKTKIHQNETCSTLSIKLKLFSANLRSIKCSKTGLKQRNDIRYFIFIKAKTFTVFLCTFLDATIPRVLIKNFFLILQYAKTLTGMT